ncbi:MAG: fatty acid desaturase [Pseudomonadota bacterium]
MSPYSSDKSTAAEPATTDIAPRASLFRFTEDRLPVAIFLALFAVDLLVFAVVSSWPLVLAWAALSVPAKVCIAAWNHHHQHVPFFRSTLCNRLIEIVFGLQTGAVANVWVLHHNLGHHDHYMDQSKDESAWRAPDGRVMSTNEYTWKLALTGYVCAIKNSAEHPGIRQTFLLMLGLHVALLAALVWINPFNATAIFIIPMLISFVMTCRHTYDHHAGCSETDEYAASNNIVHRWYNILTGNLGYHTAHHLRPGLHWSKLPAFHARIADKIPVANYRGPGLPMSLLPGTPKAAAR